MVAKAANVFALLTAMRALCIVTTILPTLLPVPPLSVLSFLTGAGHDFIFSGHTAFVASWVFASEARLLVWFACAVHAVALLAARMHYTVDIVVAWLLASLLRSPAAPVELVMVHRGDPLRKDIFQLRHEVYAKELEQHPVNPDAALSDDTDEYNVYIAATRSGAVQGFIAITPPGRPKRLERHGVEADDGAYELRLLTVRPGCRGRGIGSALMYAAARYVQASGGVRLEAIGRVEVLPAYIARGMRPVSDGVIRSGKLDFVHIAGELEHMHQDMPPGFEWRLPFPQRLVAPCHHGGRGLETLEPTGINADVLDAWFPPAPAVFDAITKYQCDVGVTPPARCDNLLSALSAARGVDSRDVLLGAGSSDLIYRCFWTWLTPSSHVLLLHPTYAEYEHVLHAIGCRVTRLELQASDGYALAPKRVPPGEYDLVVLVNPNSPTGLFADILPIHAMFPESTLVWVDETYIEYAGRGNSIERHVAEFQNLVVCKSMSKSYALSGVRVGYVCGPSLHLSAVRVRSPPWIVSRVAQRAAVAALTSDEYYERRYEETHLLRASLASCLDELGWDVVKGSCANFVMARAPSGLDVAAFVEECAASKLFIRQIDESTVRIAVKGPDTLKRMLKVLRDVQARL